MSARDQIMARLRQAQLQPHPRPSDVNRITASTLVGDLISDPVSAFRAALEAMHAEVIELTLKELPSTLARVCNEKGIRRLMLPPTALPGLGDITYWDGGPVLLRFDSPIEDRKDMLFREIDAGLTVADCGIADTGMLVMASSPQQPRTLSLVPPIHICILDRQKLHASLPAALSYEDWATRMPSNLIFVSGPSKTADIQQTLAYGAHGPKELIVLLIDLGAAK